ncbi:transmembrane protein 106A [Lepisosteus oculatus]
MMGVSLGSGNASREEKESVISQRKGCSREDYRSINRSPLEDGDLIEETLDCPTCQGTGRIPRGQENQLVALIPYSDQRLKPTHTKLYVTMSVLLCMLTCSLALFFLFPRSIFLSPVKIQSVYVEFSPSSVNMSVTNVLNITNDNYYGISSTYVDIQALIFEKVVGRVRVIKKTQVRPRSVSEFTYTINAIISDEGLLNYCMSPKFNIHTLFLHMQLTMNASYLAHSEQLSLDTFEYVDCGTNTTTPHMLAPSGAGSL